MIKNLKLEEKINLIHALHTAIDYYEERIAECEKFEKMEDCTEWYRSMIIKWQQLIDIL